MLRDTLLPKLKLPKNRVKKSLKPVFAIKCDYNQ